MGAGAHAPGPQAPAVVARLRLAKSGPARFMSHLDFVRALERAARRARLPVALSTGFHPHPRMSFSPALGVGISSDCEFVDVELAERLDAEEVAGRLRGCLPPGIELVSVGLVAPGGTSISALIRAASYRVCLREADVYPEDEVRRAVASILGADTLRVTRSSPKGEREVDLRPLIHDLRFDGRQGLPCLGMLVAAGPEGGARPLEVVRLVEAHGGLRPDARPVSIARDGLYVWKDGRFVLPS